MQTHQTAIDVEVLTLNHTESLKITFNEAITQHFITNEGIRECLIVYRKLRDAISAQRPSNKRIYFFYLSAIAHNF